MFNAMAECVSVDSVTKCVALRTNVKSYTSAGKCTVHDGILSDVLIDPDTGYAFPITATVECAAKGGTGTIGLQSSWYVINNPFSVELALPFYWLSSTSKCDTECPPGPWPTGLSWSENVTQLSDDECPDGFYTISYDVACGEGFVDISDVPDCSENTSGTSCYIEKGIPCGTISDCGDTSFTNENGKYVLKYTACVGGSCAKSETEFSACGNGYYGDGVSCTKCPQNIKSDVPTYTDNGNGTLTLISNAREERDCYVTPDMKFNDISGSYSYVSNCSYTHGYVY